MTHNPFSRAVSALVLAAALALGGLGQFSIARADDDGTATPTPPVVARLSVVEGDVGVKHDGESEQVAAAINAPLEGGDYVSTGNDGRAEVQLDASNLVRAGNDTQIRFTQLDGTQDTVQLAQGTVELRVLQADDDHVSLQTPSVDVVADEAGAYVVTVDSDGQTFVTARSGSLDVTTPQGSQTIEPGKTMQITGSADNPQYQFIDAIAATDFDQWADTRDQQLMAVANDPNVNQNMMGAQDLDSYGHWSNVSGYGEVWQPNNEPQGWTPYTDGNWSYQNYYGWTWVAAEPWGWAPYHYGRWAYLNSGWCWVPGRRDSAPVYSPALVAFFGFGHGSALSVGFNFGNVGWVPLAPGESYHSDYRQYRNFHHGFVGMPVDRWQHGDFHQITHLNTAPNQNMQPIVGRLPLNPTVNNYRYIPHVVNQPVKPNYVRFNTIRPISTVGRGTVRIAPTSNGWQHFNSTRTTVTRYNTPTSSTTTTTHGSSAWQHFNNTPRTNTYSTVRQPQTQYQRPTYQRQQYQQQPTYQRQQYQQRPTYQRQQYQQQPTYQRQQYQQQPTYQRQQYQQQPTYQRQQYQQPSYQRQPQASYQRPTYQRQSYQSRPSGGSQSRAPSPRGSANPHPHGPGTM